MRTLALALAAAGLFVAPALTLTQAQAQDVRIRAGEGGVTIRSHEPRYEHRRDHRRYGDERRWRRHDRDVRVIGRPGCRNVTVRSERPNGDVVVRRMRRC